MRKGCAQIVERARVGLGKLGGFIHQVVFATQSMGTSRVFLPSLFELSAQVSTHGYFAPNGLVLGVVPTIHRTNGKGNKENIL